MRSEQNGPLTTGYRRTVMLERGEAEDLIARTLADGFDSPAYRTLSEHLWGYAMPVLKKALRTNGIKRMLDQQGIIQPISAEDRLALHSSPDARASLAVDIITAGEGHLREVTIQRQRWNPDRGASIEPFFVTGCLFQFPTVYRRWSSERADSIVELAGRYPAALATVASLGDTAATATDRELARVVLNLADGEVHTILTLLAAGLTHAEIGEHVGLSAKAVEGRLYRFKMKVRLAMGVQPAQPWKAQVA